MCQLPLIDPHMYIYIYRYHLIEDPPPNEEVAARLVQRPDDTEVSVKEKITAYRVPTEGLLGHKHENHCAPRRSHTAFVTACVCCVHAIDTWGDIRRDVAGNLDATAAVKAALDTMKPDKGD